jgi:hypothetical protein
MEKTKTGKLKWRKVGGGSFRMASGRIIKPNEVFHARVEDIPAPFRDMVVQLEDEEATVDVTQLGASDTPVKVKIVPVEDTGTSEFGVLPDAPDQNDPDNIVQDMMDSGTAKIEVAGAGWYNVVNSATGKVLNEKKLRKDAADKFLAGLSE